MHVDEDRVDARAEALRGQHGIDRGEGIVERIHEQPRHHVDDDDAQVLPGGTAYQTDAGMCGDYDSVIGMKKEAAVQRFVRKMPGERLSPAEGEGTMCGVFVELDPGTGRALRVDPVRAGGRLKPALPA